MLRHSRLLAYFLSLVGFSSLQLLNKGAYAQSTAPSLQSIIPPSPNAASLAKFGEVPVGYYTGIPSVSVPIYEINEGGMKVPIGLSYHAGGVKVEEMASWVGLGWALNAGGAITRQVRGMPDEIGGGYLSTYHDVYKFLNNGMTFSQQQEYFTNLNTYIEDSQPDMFFFNFGSESGRFFFDTTGQVVPIPSSRIKFEFGTYLGISNTWKATDVNGDQYFFTVKESTQSFPASGSLPLNPPPVGITSWYLTAMVDAVGTDTIYFQYTHSLTTFNSIASQTKYLLASLDGACQAKIPENNSSSNWVDGWHLAKILFRNGTAEFHTNAATRCDYPGDTALNSIIIRSNNGQFYRRIQLYQSYYGTDATISCDGNHPDNFRLMLDSLTIGDSVKPVEHYRFDYNEVINMPSRLSYNQDHWGFYNGALNGTDFIPESDLMLITGAPLLVSGANRDANPSFSQALSLQSITYPTGGRTEFEFENNTIGKPGSIPIGLVLGNRFIGLNPNNNPGGTGPRRIDTTFTISDDFQALGGVNGLITLNNGGGDCAMAQSLTCPLVTITGPSGTGGNVLSSQTMFLPKGSYEIVIDLSGVTDQSIIDNFFFSLSWSYETSTLDSTQNHNVPVGGLRVKKITNFDANNSIAQVRKFTYLIPDSVNYSSGSLLSYPQYIGSITINQVTTNQASIQVVDQCAYTTISSNSNLPLLETQGSYTGYGFVQEWLGVNGEFGKNTYEYTSPANFADDIQKDFPYPPANSFDWRRGQLMHANSYRHSGEGYDLIHEKINDYGDNPTITVKGIKIGQNFFDQRLAGTPQFETSTFQTSGGWAPLVDVTERTYDQNNLTAFTEVTHHYIYNDSYFLPILDSTVNSKGEAIITTTTYPLDYTTLTGSDALTTGILSLQTKNIIAVPVEKTTRKENTDGSGGRVTASILTSFKPDKPLPDTIWAIEPTGSGTTSFGAASVSSGHISKSGLYVPKIVFLKYDSQGNVIEQQKVHDLNSTYLWDYLHSYPIAEVKNADSNSVAYTSFESDGSGNWSIGSNTRLTGGITGTQSYELSNGSISRSALTSGTTYILSYWTQNSGAFPITGTVSGYPIKGKTATIGSTRWTYFEHKITGVTSVTLSGSGPIDELRLYPANAQMATYAYSPLIGMTAQIDAASRITYYEYDGLARLKRIRDQDYNILKTFDYQYQVASGCGNGCYSIPMQTFLGTGTIGYPVGVFNVHQKLLGNATGPVQYVSLWNSDSADNHLGTLSTGLDSLHFSLTLDSGRSLPSGVIGLRYYQVDITSDTLDGFRNFNAAYIDFGDGIGMKMGTGVSDVAPTIAANTTYHIRTSGDQGSVLVPYYRHFWPNSSQKTLTFYHNDNVENNDLDNDFSPEHGLDQLKNFRGNLALHDTIFGGSCFQQPTMNSIDSIKDWYSITSIRYFRTNSGDLVNPCKHLHYQPDFMKNNRNLQSIFTERGYRQSGYLDTTFKLSTLKSDWNTYFTNLQDIRIMDDHWNREDLSTLTKLRIFALVASTQDHLDGAGSPLTVISTSVIDNILNQISAGAGQTVTNGIIHVATGGLSNRSAASDSAYNNLIAKGWIIIID